MNKRLVILVTLVLAAVLFYLIVAKLERGPAAPNSASPRSERFSEARPDPETLKRFLAIEAERNALDQTVWAQELLSHRYEEPFLKLWDALRASQNGLDVLEKFPFGQLIIGTNQIIETIEHGISRHRVALPGPIRSQPDWQQFVRGFQAQGYELDYSEWRHARFEPQTNGPTRSTFVFTLNVTRSNPSERVALRGQMQVEWGPLPEPEGDPVPEKITVTELEMVRRAGPSDFQVVMSQELEPDQETIFIDPLILHDLNGDGLSELILGCNNLVIWNLGQGRFKRAPLCQHFEPKINVVLFADVTGDGVSDCVAADLLSLLVYAGQTDGQFPESPRRVAFTSEAMKNPFVMTAGDIDQDGDLDLWLAQYKVPYVEGQMPTPYYDANDGFPGYLLVNDGQGNFVDRTEASGLATKRFRRTYSCSFLDYDNDQDLDLVMVSDFAGMDLFENLGRGQFRDVTGELLDERHAFGMAHTVADYNLDGHMDLLMIGMNSFVGQRLDALGLGPDHLPAPQQMRSKMAYGNRLLFWQKDRFRHTELSAKVASTGWSWGATSFDFDNDADTDIYIVNGHKSRASTRDYERQFWRHDIYAASSKHDPAMDQYFRSTATRLYGAGYSYGGFEKNRLFLNRAGKDFLEIGHLAGVALEEDCRNVVSDDLDGDGKVDLVLTTFEEWPRPRQGLHILRNVTAGSNHWIGFHLKEKKGFSTSGAKVILHAGGRRQLRWMLNGDSYRSQHANTVHFGIGSAEQVESVEIHWPNGKVQRVRQPAIDRYHRVIPEAP
ncbi:MAG: CRTAC1 family protein [Verrucomicrobiota bacterium]